MMVCYQVISHSIPVHYDNLYSSSMFISHSIPVHYDNLYSSSMLEKNKNEEKGC